MNLEHYYWYFDSVLSDKFCDDLIAYGNAQQEQIALTGRETEKVKKQEPLTEEDIKDLKQKRNSNIVWLSDKWIYDEIHPYIHTANKNSGWNFDWNWSESCQFTKYKLNQYYDWHCDSWAGAYDAKSGSNFEGKIRKLSVSCLLSDPKDYKGGDLEFQSRNQDDPNIIHNTEHIRKRGSVIVFPSFVWHRVKPVTEGVRYSLVIWNLGPPWK